jgi:hypothetical protein
MILTSIFSPLLIAGYSATCILDPPLKWQNSHASNPNNFLKLRNDMLQLLIVIELHSSRTRRGALLLCSVSIHELICDSSAHNSSCLLRGRLAVAVLWVLSRVEWCQM